MPEREIEPVEKPLPKPTLDFHEAVAALKAGKKVTEPGSANYFKTIDGVVFRHKTNGERQICSLPGMKSPQIEAEAGATDKVYMEVE